MNQGGKNLNNFTLFSLKTNILLVDFIPVLSNKKDRYSKYEKLPPINLARNINRKNEKKRKTRNRNNVEHEMISLVRIEELDNESSSDIRLKFDSKKKWQSYNKVNKIKEDNIKGKPKYMGVKVKKKHKSMSKNKKASQTK